MTTTGAHGQVRALEMRLAELGEGFAVARALPTKQQRMVGPWCFLDHLGPAQLSPTQGLYIGSHPHTALQTFTWMMQGQILHRDSLGSELIIKPGQVNLMTAGHGICHTEESLGERGALHSAQLWIALPAGQEDIPPAFDHYAELPSWGQGQTQLTLLAGAYADHVAPTRVYSEMIGMDVRSAAGDTQRLQVRGDFEYAVLVCEGQVQVNGKSLTSQQFAYLPVGAQQLELTLARDSRCLLIGGVPFAKPVLMWWNFVGPSQAYIAAAVADWQAKSARFGEVAQARNRLDAPYPPWMTAP